MKKVIIILIISAGAGLLWAGAKNDFWLKPAELILNDVTQASKVLEYQKEVPAETASLPSTGEISSSTKKEVNPALSNGVKEIEKVFLVINFSEGKGIKKVETEFKDGMTVFDLLQKGAEEQGLILETKSYSLGVFIETIGDKKNGSGNKYWIYYVNGKFAQVAADKFELKAGDKVEWKFEKSPL